MLTTKAHKWKLLSSPILHCFILYHIISYIILHCFILHHITLCYVTLYYGTVCHEIFMNCIWIHFQAPVRHGLLAIGGVTILRLAATAWGLPHDLPAPHWQSATIIYGCIQLAVHTDLPVLRGWCQSVNGKPWPVTGFTDSHINCSNWHYPSLRSCPHSSWSCPHYLWGLNTAFSEKCKIGALVASFSVNVSWSIYRDPSPCIQGLNFDPYPLRPRFNKH